MAKRGRKSKWSQERAERIIDAIQKSHPLKVAAAYGGIAYQTFLDWQQPTANNGKPYRMVYPTAVHPEAEMMDFSEAVARAEAVGEGGMVEVLRDAAAGRDEVVIKRKTFPTKDGGTGESVTIIKRRVYDTDAAKFLLARRYRDNWKDKQEIEVTDGTDALQDLSDEEVAALLGKADGGKDA